MRPQVGTELTLTEPEYKFGVGSLLCRVTHVIAPVLFDNALWWHLRGECAYGTHEHHSGWQTRELYVIDSAITK
jgi:hypothetical protein